MKTSIIRQKFIDFFRKKGHTFIPAAPILQQDNPSLFFINAGMNPFTHIFLGNQSPSTLRAANSQPCLRVAGKHNDLEEVGVDTYHHTLFEMLGNWSFGDYFKKEAIAYAWELITEVYQIPKERLYVTVFEGDREDGLEADEESYELWRRYLPEAQILYAGKKDNFWEMGAMGPCGPCSEIHVDLRSSAIRQDVPGHTLVNGDHPHVIEIWNLVFMQYHRQASGVLVPLPKCHVDTGMGLERLAMVLQGKQATYDTDAFQPLITAVAQQASTIYGGDSRKDVALRVASDHIRAISFAIASGALPSNHQAGYVVRRLLRRAVRYGYQLLHLKSPFLYDLVPILIHTMGEAYPMLKVQEALIRKVIYEEEQNFLRTLAQGLRQFQHFRSHAQGSVIDGKAAFQLYDTYGFPIDLTQLIAHEEGMTVDSKGFEEAMEVQKNRSKKVAVKTSGDWVMVHGEDRTSQFVGYDQLSTESLLLAYRCVQQRGETCYQLVLDQTPFYPEGGGQVGDQGVLYIGDEKIAVLDTRKEEGVIMHYVDRLPSDRECPVKAVVDKERRKLAANNHTATHLLEAALRHILGRHVTQRGSYLDHERLRFDFTHPERLTKEQCEAIEALVNERIRANTPCVEEREVSFEEAKRRGALSLVGEQYGEKVRVITFDPAYSIALCGGTHVASTGEIGYFKLIAETSVAAGIRRIEAVTAVGAERWVRQMEAELVGIQKLLKYPQDIIQAVEAIQKTNKKAQKTIAAYQEREVQEAKHLIQQSIQNVGDIYIGIARVGHVSVEIMRKAMFLLNKSYAPLLLVSATLVEGKAYVAVMVSEALLNRYDARKIVTALAPYVGGKGGGNEKFAMIHSQQVADLDQLLVEARKIIVA